MSINGLIYIKSSLTNHCFLSSKIRFAHKKGRDCSSQRLRKGQHQAADEAGASGQLVLVEGNGAGTQGNPTARGNTGVFIKNFH